jgi:hypothetical protein
MHIGGSARVLPDLLHHWPCRHLPIAAPAQYGVTDGLRALERVRLRPVAVSAACLAENSRSDTGAGLRDSQMNG